MTTNLTWTCALHGPVASGDCPRCDDEALALLDDFASSAGVIGAACKCRLKLIPVGASSTWDDGIEHSPTECLRDYFLAPDGANEPTLWRRNLDRPDYPTALRRRSDVGSEVWRLIETHPEVAPHPSSAALQAAEAPLPGAGVHPHASAPGSSDEGASE